MGLFLAGLATVAGFVLDFFEFVIDGDPAPRPTPTSAFRGWLAEQDHGDAVLSVAVNSDGGLVASGSKGRVLLWAVLADGRVQGPQQVPGLPNSFVKSLAFIKSGNGTTLLAAYANGTIDAFDVSTGHLRQVADGLRAHATGLTAMAVSPTDPTVIATASVDDTARLWRLTDAGLSPIGAPLTHAEDVNALAFSPDGTTLVTGSDDDLAKTWAVAGGTTQPIRELLHDNDVTSVAFIGQDIVTVQKNEHHLRLWTPGAVEHLTTLDGPATATSLSIAQGSRTLAFGVTDGPVRIAMFKGSNGTDVSGLAGTGPTSANTTAISADGRVVVSGSESGKVAIAILGHPTH